MSTMAQEAVMAEFVDPLCGLFVIALLALAAIATLIWPPNRCDGDGA